MVRGFEVWGLHGDIGTLVSQTAQSVGDAAMSKKHANAALLRHFNPIRKQSALAQLALLYTSDSIHNAN